MVKYTCPNCNKDFKQKQHFIEHTEYKKKPCVRNETNSNLFQNNLNNTENSINDNNVDKNQDNDLNKCKYCHKKFSTTFNLNKHVKNSCKVKKLENEKKENIFNSLIEIDELKQKFLEIAENNKNLIKITEILQKQNDDLNKKNEDLNKKIDTILKKNNKNVINNLNNNSNNTNITNITISPLNAFGKENLKSIKPDDFYKIITDSKNTGKHCINRIVDLIHFNTNVPENMNVYMSDFNRDKYMVYNGDNWVLNQNGEMLAFEILEHLRKLFHLNETEEFQHKIENDKNFAKHFNVTFKKYFNFLFDEDETEMTKEEIKKHNDFKQMIENEIIIKLYNNKTNVIDSYNKNYNKNNILKLE